MPEVSVIIPVYNSEKYVEKCICSVMAQTLPELEIIIINDGSIDESGKILRKLAQKDSRIILLEQENKGVAAARNLGVEKATGKYLTFVDGDDYLQEDYIEKMYSLAEKETLDMVICGLTYVDEGGKELNKIIPGVYKRLENEEWTFRISAVCSHLYKRELWEKYDVKFQSGERGEVLSRRKGEFAYTAKAGMEHRIHQESTTSELIEENGRRAEDLYMFRKFWPGWIAKMIERVYQKSEESNEV